MRNRARLGVLWACLVAAVLAAQAGAASGAAPETPAGGKPLAVVDDVAYTDDAGAQAAWRPMEGTAPVGVADIDGRRALRMPCNFAGTRIERASWDRSVRLDMTSVRGLRFRLLCRDASPIGHFSIYFRSGEGWYAGSFGPQRTGQWDTVTVDRESTRIEGRPAGWGQVDTIRISAWRGQDVDTEFCLADLALVGDTSDLVVVRAESSARRSPRETEAVGQYTESMARMLADAGLEASVISDLDLTPARLADKRLVILPHNPSMAEEADRAIAAFLEGGGKVLGFYNLPGSVASAAGVRWKGHVSETRRGSFASIRFGEGAPAGAPAVVGQASWNIQDVEPASDRCRVAARWFDDQGRDTGHAAVLVSDRCIYMTHVLLDDDRAAKRQMLRALVGHLVPEAWSRAAAGTLARVGRFGRFETFEEARGALAAAAADRPPARDALARAERRRGEAEALAQEGKFIEALDAGEAAQRDLLDAWCLAQKAAPGEHRAFWCHSAFGPAGLTWDESIKVLADNGFTAILPNMLWGGAAFYESRVLPVAAEVQGRGDQVALCLAACRKYGVECHVWKVNWNMGWRAPKEFAARMKEEGRTQVLFDGSPNDGWLCPSHPANRKLEIDSMVEVATKYDVDGIHFDYIRYPGPEACFCAGCRERFEQALGRKVERWPADLRSDAAVRAKWLDFRREQITAVVAEVARIVHKERPKCRISAAVFRDWPLDRDTVGQDWKTWCDRGYLDFVCPMDYTPYDAQFEGMVRRQLEWAGKVPCYPGIGLSTWSDPGDVARLIEQVSIARRLGCRGFTVFEFNGTSARQVAPACGKGLTRK